MIHFDLPGLKRESEELNEKTLADDFWSDSDAAQKVLQKKKAIDDKIKAYEELLGEFEELEELLALCDEMEADGEVEAQRQSRRQVRPHERSRHVPLYLHYGRLGEADGKDRRAP